MLSYKLTKASGKLVKILFKFSVTFFSATEAIHLRMPTDRISKEKSFASEFCGNIEARIFLGRVQSKYLLSPREM